MKEFLNISAFLISILIFYSCNSEKSKWIECQKDNTFIGYFNFAFENRETEYFDSAISYLNEKLNNYRSFNINFDGDSITYDDYGNTHRDYSKQFVIAYNLTNGDLLYRDSLFTNVTTTEKYLRSFIKQSDVSKYHCIFIYPDTLGSSETWINMFIKIDYILSIYNEQRNVYSNQTFQKDYSKLPIEKRQKIDSDLPINLFLSFNKQILYFWSEWFKYIETKE